MALSRAEETCQEQIKRADVNTRSLKNNVDMGNTICFREQILQHKQTYDSTADVGQVYSAGPCRRC